MKKTFDTDHNVKYLIAKIRNDLLRQKLLPYEKYDWVNFWDFGVKASEHLQVNDTVYIVCGRFEYVYKAQLVGVIKDPSGHIGDILEWTPSYDQLFRNVAVLVGLQKTNVDITSLRKALDGNPLTPRSKFYLVPD